MKHLKRALMALTVIGLFSLSGLAWDAHGHMMTAAAAFQVLSAEQSNKVLTLLKSHPAFKQWEAEYKNAKPDIKETFTAEAYYFMRAAVWPDDIRSGSNPQHRESVPDRHFINYVLRLPGTLDLDIKPPKENILAGFAEAVTAIEKSDVKADRKAIWLSWIFHLAGDVHQPLHAVTLKSSDWPDGDRGGNELCLRPDKDPMNPDKPIKATKLHEFWDHLFEDRTSRLYTAMDAWRDADFYFKGLKDVNPGGFTNPAVMTDWAKESAVLARDDVYQFHNQPLKLVKTVKAPGGGDSGCPVMDEKLTAPDNYTFESRKLAARQIVLGGYRLASVLSAMSFQ